MQNHITSEPTSQVDSKRPEARQQTQRASHALSPKPFIVLVAAPLSVAGREITRQAEAVDKGLTAIQTLGVDAISEPGFRSSRQ
jgi:hypothetical protein